MTIFYDSARSGLIPSGSSACVYFDGRYAITPAQAKRFSRTRWITIAGGASAAAHTGCIDYEHGNLAYEGNQLREWALARQAMHCRSRIYSNFSDLKAAHAQTADIPGAVHWVATLDGVQLTVPQIVAKAHEFGVVLVPAKVWAQQWKGGPTAPFDESILLGTW